MRNLGFVQITLLIVFILVPLLRYVLQRVKRRLEELPEEDSVTKIRQEAQATLAPLPAPRAYRNKLHASQAPAVATRLVRSHSTRRSLLGNIRDVRRGMIVMTILGPCRAFDSPE